MRTMRLQMCALDAGRATNPHRTTANSLFSVVSGRGTSNVDGSALAWERGDTEARWGELVPAYQDLAANIG